MNGGWEITLAKAVESPEIWQGISKAEPDKNVCVLMPYADLEAIYDILMELRRHIYESRD